MRIGLKPEHVARLPEEARQDLKDGDVRTPKFKLDYPELKFGYQIEALPGRRLNELVTAALQAHVDVRALNDASRLSRSVSNWLTEHVEKAISDYEDNEYGMTLDKVILEEGELIDP